MSFLTKSHISVYTIHYDPSFTQAILMILLSHEGTFNIINMIKGIILPSEAKYIILYRQLSNRSLLTWRQFKCIIFWKDLSPAVIWHNSNSDLPDMRTDICDPSWHVQVTDGLPDIMRASDSVWDTSSVVCWWFLKGLIIKYRHTHYTCATSLAKALCSKVYKSWDGLNVMAVLENTQTLEIVPKADIMKCLVFLFMATYVAAMDNSACKLFSLLLQYHIRNY